MLNEKVYDWKISIIAQYNKKWDREYAELIQAVKKQLFSDRFRFIVFTYYTNDNPDEMGSATIVEYYKGMDDKVAVNPAPCDLYDPAILNNFFGKNVKVVTASYHALIVWGHGAGLGYLPTVVDDITRHETFLKIFNPVPVTDSDKIKQAIDYRQAADTMLFLQGTIALEPDFSLANSRTVRFGNNVYEVKNGEALGSVLKVISSKELCEALKYVGQKTDLLIASTCYCQLFEMGLYLKEQVSIMVAAETSIPISGFNYTSFFNRLRLLDVPAVNNWPAKQEYLKTLASNVVYNFNKKYTQAYLNHLNDNTLDYNKDTIAISANDLSKYDGITDVLTKLGDVLKTCYNETDPDYKSAVGNARKHCLDMLYPNTGMGIIDLTLVVTFLKQYFNALSDTRIDPILDQLQTVRQECNIALLTTDELANTPTPPYEGATQKPQFLSIFFPFTGNSDVQTQLYELFFKQPLSSNAISISDSWNQFVRAFVQERLFS